MNKSLKKITSERLTSLTAYTDKCIRLSKKATSRDLSDVLSCMKDLYHIVILSLDICILCNKSANIVSKQLKQHLFIPLYTVFLAISARLLKIMSSLLLHFYNLLTCLITQMKHIGLMQSRFASSIDTTLKEIALSTNQLNYINVFRGSINLDNDSNNNNNNNIKRSNDISNIVVTNEDVGEYISNSVSVSMDIHIPQSTDEYSDEPLGDEVDEVDEIFSERTDDSLYSKRKFSNVSSFSNKKKTKYN